MAGMTLAQLAALETEPLRKGIFMNIIRDIPLMSILPFENINSLRTIAIRWEKLPTGGAWRKLNEGYTAAQNGTVGQVEESLYGFGGEILYDRVLTKITNTIEDPVTLQTKMKIKALAYDWKDKFVNGDHATDEDAIEGLKKRVAALPARQRVTATGTGSTAALDVTASASVARKFINRWEQAYKRCNDGDVQAIFCNEDFLLGFGAAIRLVQSGGNFLDTTKDVLGREFVTWKGAPFYDLGYKADQSTEIITNTEAGDDGAAEATSVYFSSFNKENGIYGIQLEALNVYDPLTGGETSSAPQLMRRIDWWNGLAMFGSYGLVRLRNIKAPSSWTE